MLSRKLLLLGFFLVPIENLSVAPSSGWPAIAPVIFFLVAALNIKKMRFSKKEITIIFFLSLWSVVGWTSSFLLTDGNRFFVKDVVGALMPLFLGYAFYKVIRITLDDRLLLKEGVNSFILGSIFSLLCSMVILIFGYISKNAAFLSLTGLLLKRNSDIDRFSFLFAEPSFVSVHILGFLVPVLYICKLNYFNSEFSRLLGILAAYCVVGLLFMDSARFYVDLFVLMVIFSVFYFSDSFRNFSVMKFAFLFVFLLPPFIMMLSFPEVIETLTMGRVDVDGNFEGMINSDGSLASRYFRTDAVVSSILSDHVLLLTGVGYGNIGLLVDLGYDDAMSRFFSPFTKEVFDIYRNGNGSNIYNMYVRLIGEFGVFVSFFVMFLLYNKNHAFLFAVACWCYLQFDSYAFYTVWLYLAVCGTGLKFAGNFSTRSFKPTAEIGCS